MSGFKSFEDVQKTIKEVKDLQYDIAARVKAGADRPGIVSSMKTLDAKIAGIEQFFALEAKKAEIVAGAYKRNLAPRPARPVDDYLAMMEESLGMEFEVFADDDDGDIELPPVTNRQKQRKPAQQLPRTQSRAPRKGLRERVGNLLWGEEAAS